MSAAEVRTPSQRAATRKVGGAGGNVKAALGGRPGRSGDLA
jgi:hypothetical protein